MRSLNWSLLTQESKELVLLDWRGFFFGRTEVVIPLVLFLDEPSPRRGARRSKPPQSINQSIKSTVHSFIHFISFHLLVSVFAMLLGSSRAAATTLLFRRGIASLSRRNNRRRRLFATHVAASSSSNDSSNASSSSSLTTTTSSLQEHFDPTDDHASLRDMLRDFVANEASASENNKHAKQRKNHLPFPPSTNPRLDAIASSCVLSHNSYHLPNSLVVL